jgi:putative glutamine amidotransferase
MQNTGRRKTEKDRRRKAEGGRPEPEDGRLHRSTGLVAISATTELIRGAPRVRVNQAYTDALQRAGLVPIVVPPLSADDAARLIERVDGLVLTGGEDVDPALYGARRGLLTDEPHAARDACEIALIHAAHARRVPTLAICRGIQVLNVALGGTLIQDIASERPAALPHAQDGARQARVHDVSFTAGSALARTLGAERIRVNSMHHQSVDRVGEGLVVTGTAPDGIIEGVEWTGEDWWMLAVQWHPEELDQTPEDWDRTLFVAFAHAVTGSSANAPRRVPAASGARAN